MTAHPARDQAAARPHVMRPLAHAPRVDRHKEAYVDYGPDGPSARTAVRQLPHTVPAESTTADVARYLQRRAVRGWPPPLADSTRAGWWFSGLLLFTAAGVRIAAGQGGGTGKAVEGVGLAFLGLMVLGVATMHTWPQRDPDRGDRRVINAHLADAYASTDRGHGGAAAWAGWWAPQQHTAMVQRHRREAAPSADDHQLWEEVAPQPVKLQGQAADRPWCSQAEECPGHADGPLTAGHAPALGRADAAVHPSQTPSSQ